MVNSMESSTPKTNNGPRVSFNRDVHVKRYGSLLNNDNLNCDSNSRSQSPPNLRRELPNDLSHEALEREAALVLEQVNNFGSLPHRKQNKKSLRRSKSDASSKKSKRNSIFNFFNSTPASSSTNTPINPSNNNNNNSNTNNNNIKKDTATTVNSNKKVARSKSDVSSHSVKNKQRGTKLHLTQNDDNGSTLMSSDSDNNTRVNSLRRKKAPLTPITEVNTPVLDDNKPRTDYFDTDKKFLSKSMESMHSSQMPAEKLPLTKNVRVDKIIKRLSVERLSPPPLTVLQAGGFSYTNPTGSPTTPTNKSFGQSQLHTNHVDIVVDNNNSIITSTNSPINHNSIVYTQVVSNAEKPIQTKIETTHKASRTKSAAASPIDNLHTQKTDSNDLIVDKRADDEVDNQNNNIASTNEEEPIIKANIRKHMPRYSSQTQIDNINFNSNHHNNLNNYLDHEFDRLHEMRETDNHTLSSRRKILESRIKSRIGGLQSINNDNNHHHTRSQPPTTAKITYNSSSKHHGSSEFIHRGFSPERFNKSSSPPINKYGTTHVDDGLTRKNSHGHKNNERYTDSGNETDVVARNNSYNRNRYSSRFNIGRKWNYEDDIIECELFLMKERKHTEETYPYQLVRTYVYRQHTNNDDTYDTDQDKKNIIKEWKHNKKMTREFLKSQTKTKKSGLEKVKELFKLKGSNNKNSNENELRARYREYSPEIEPPPQKTSAQQTSIVNRRRLSTPTSSPMTTSRSKSLPPKVAVNRNVSTLRREKQVVSSNGNGQQQQQQQKFNWFASLERLSRKKNRDSTSNTQTIDRRPSINRAKSSSMRNISMTNGSNKNLRFFGDTDLDEVDSRMKSPDYDEAREMSTSLQNLNSARRMRQSKSVSRSRAELLNIAESTSDEAGEKPITRSRPVSPSYNNYLPPPRPPKSTKLVRSVSTLPRPMPRKSLGQENIEHDSYYPSKRDSNLESDSNFSTSRRLRNSLSVSRENLQRDRFDSDASQRSVVYLHASVVGDIPQTYGARRLSGKSSVKTAYNEEQAITRTVNSSLSMDAPWKPKFISDGYEINYSNDQKDVANNRRSKFRSKSAPRDKNKWDKETHKRV